MERDRSLVFQEVGMTADSQRGKRICLCITYRCETEVPDPKASTHNYRLAGHWPVISLSPDRPGLLGHALGVGTQPHSHILSHVYEKHRGHPLPPSYFELAR